MVRKFFVLFLASVISLSVFCVSAFAWEPSSGDDYTSISLKLPDGSETPICYMPIGSDGYTATWNLITNAVNGISISWHTDNDDGFLNVSLLKLLSLYGLSSGKLIGLGAGLGAVDEFSVEAGQFSDPKTPKHFVFEAVFANSVPKPPDPTVPTDPPDPDPTEPSEPSEPDPNEYIMEIYNQSGELLKTLSGSGIGSPFKAVIYPGINRLVLSVFDSSWEATSKDLSHLHLDPSMIENVSASQIINAGTSGFKLTALGNLLRVVVIYDMPTPDPSPDPGPDSGSPPALAYFGAFLTSVLGSFFAFELIPGLTLGGMFGFFIVLAIAVCVLKHFQG